MAGSYTTKYLDNLSDNTLKLIHLLLTMAQSPERTRDGVMIGDVMDMVDGMSDSQVESFSVEVSQAVKRRFGPVPGQ